MNSTKCKICGSENSFLFSTKILLRYDVNYYKCPTCEFIQTDEPHWINEAYKQAITSLDIGYVTRNVMYSEIVRYIIKLSFKGGSIFLDNGGGYGIFVRLMRDKGYNFYRSDKYCENLFSKYFDITDIDQHRFEMITAFEVFEHLQNPIEEIKKMLKLSDSILFSTELIPNNNITSVTDWWYFTPETGQHIALYSKITLKYIANTLELNLYTNDKNLHLLTKKKLSLNSVKIVDWFFLQYNMIFSRHFGNKKTMLKNDLNHCKKMLKDNRQINL